ncbi:MAG: hypothetical protein JSU98_00365 [Gemmatimonadales bacterium]|jgi:hypothetical protein|nr:MAG: hypothetical protein JSU98_00365 [Gemmatimonadales bacterium]
MINRILTTSTRHLAVAGACAALAACADYTVETTLRADGSGVREVRVEVTDAPDSQEARQDFLAVTHLTEADGWIPGFHVESDGDTVFTFYRTTEVPNLAAWAQISGTVAIDGTIPAHADDRVGYVRLGDVRFHNTVRVARGRTSDGTTTLRYEETFTWEQALDILVEALVQSLDDQLDRRFPRLAPAERGQIAGTFRTRFWMMVDAGILDEGADEEALTGEMARTTAEQAARVVRPRYPDTSVGELETLILDVVEGDEIFMDVERKIPGVDLGFNTAIVFRLRLPGEVTDHNAEREEEGVLVWEFGPDDTLLAPVEIRAEAVVGG